MTSSRADYGIYKPLLQKLALIENIDLTLIVFGMHLQEKHAYTVSIIKKDNFGEVHEVEGMPINDEVIDIARGYGELIINFSNYWKQFSSYDYVLALGDRFEMNAAVQAGIPFQVNFVHFHGGETTLGATDNIYRHQITLASNIHFVAAENFKNKVIDLIGTSDKVYNVGALSLDNIDNMKLPLWENVRCKFSIPEGKFILVTVHPETMYIDSNKNYSKVIYKALELLSESTHIVITLPNADAMGSLYRQEFFTLKDNYPNRVSLINNFGKENYFAAMKASEFLLGNTSSGIIEAASFEKYVINLGDRQAGRLRSANIIDVPFVIDEILQAADNIKSKRNYKGGNKYYKKNTVNTIIQILTKKWTTKNI
ncbi:UDP-N-acetylglucosamine 2-epimerase [Tenacibaculum skagerrakense]|uniref:UDP-N-acetylglucosamine 2-epimerase n=1 Tax=Tenacibaculum skagerrakense TaxID=186571 RepID=UPI001A9DEBE8|nr:UDP-N-acetylglucosamine 2-epimerase [Tenacibaculum skagerrakense]